ncbi:MAG: GMC family oxidoreductase [Burkholderiales bacterium]|nr:GMC family oxidoreductase [Burkholderiales bacterium]MDE1929257.1 GMC family oxidoreductase [Burkholderiales bacterium]MDE2157590.1 GMC family oxidoreductase [Burkholderiales bacterium]MDE2501703.1 GMC family oxidoreductase [Burkholderiales bacterium]
MGSSEHYDLIIIGSGAGGGTLAHKLAPSGKRILILERGDYLAREKQNWDPTEVFVRNRYQTPETWFDADGAPFQPGVHYYVGGATKLYGAALFRLREPDFVAHRTADGMTADWPLRYADLEPYYTQAEWLYQVHGQRGDDPTDPPASAPYPYPPVSHEPRIQEIADGLRRAGYSPSYAPCAVLLDEADPPHSRCIRCNTCDGYPCLVHAKADAEVIAVRPALAHPNVTLLTQAHVQRLQTDAGGRSVTGVIVDRQGRREAYSADIVVVSCGAANTARLLLMSASEAHPHGLANGSDLVGRHYMFHNALALVALSLRENPTRFQKTLTINDFYFGAPDYEFPLGNIQMIGKSQGPMFAADAPALAPGFALDWIADHAVDFWLTSEDLACPGNRISVGASGEIRLAYRPTNVEPLQRLRGKLQQMLEPMGMHPHLLPNTLYMGRRIPIAGVAHQAGTCRFGLDARTSVLDIHCKAHELDNLYVVDTSFFPSIGAVNPSLTAIANALRVGEHLLQRLG